MKKLALLLMFSVGLQASSTFFKDSCLKKHVASSVFAPKIMSNVEACQFLSLAPGATAKQAEERVRDLVFQEEFIFESRKRQIVTALCVIKYGTPESTSDVVLDHPLVRAAVTCALIAGTAQLALDIMTSEQFSA